MAYYGQNRMMQMQEEMARFEKEIAGQLARPPMPRAAGSNMSLRFIPHQLHPRPLAYAPPLQTVAFARGISTAAVAAAAIAATAKSSPRFQPIPAAGGPGIRFSAPPQTTGAVIEAAPTKYSAQPTTGQTTASTDAAQAMLPSSMVSTFSSSVQQRENTAFSTPSTPSKSATMDALSSTTTRSKDTTKASSSSNNNSALAYTVIGGSGASTSKATAGSQSSKRPKRYVRVGGGQVWTDPSLSEWDPNDFRIFCGDLGNEVSDELLAKAFRKYPSFQKAKVVREKRTNKTKGFGFVSFKDPDDFTRALREMDGKYVGNRPIKLRKSQWKDRNIEVVKKKVKVKQKLGLKL